MIEGAGGCVTVRFRPSRYLPPQRVVRDVTDRQQDVLAHLSSRPGGAAVREIARALGVNESPWTVREDLATVKTLGLVKSSVLGRGALEVAERVTGHSCSFLLNRDWDPTLPFSCPLGATTKGKTQQTTAQGEIAKSPDFAGANARSGTIRQDPANGS